MTGLRRWSLCLAAILLALAAMPSPAPAQAPRNQTIGVIDIQGVLRASTAVQQLSRDVEALRESTQGEMQDREEALRAADIDLAQRRGSLTPEDYTREREQLEAQGLDLQRYLQEERRRLDQRFSRGMSQVQQILLRISQDIARENDLDLLLAKTTVIIVRPEYDFTEEALQRLNSDLSEVPLPPTQDGPGQGGSSENGPGADGPTEDGPAQN
jgi:Skp family chaperone for outer membrane proteins